LSNSEVSASELIELMKARAEIERRLEAAEHTWLEAGDAAERAGPASQEQLEKPPKA
jgi:hypothetical protein